MGWVRDLWLDSDDRGPTNDPAWRARHPGSTKPMRKPDTVLCVADHMCTRGWTGGPLGTMGWEAKPEMYEFPANENDPGLD